MQYPKMLYKGDQENYQTVIADDLKVLLTERNVPFGARDSKAVLLNLVIESDGGE